MSKDVFGFIIYMIYETAERWKLSPGEAYAILQKTGCLDNYLVKHYAVLHTLGAQTVVDDIEDFIKSRRTA